MFRILSFGVVLLVAETVQPCVADFEDCAAVEFLQTNIAINKSLTTSAYDGPCSSITCPTGISTSCSNSCCTVSCGGQTQCSNLWCPQGISSSCSNGDCAIDCQGGGSIPVSSGSCESYQCPSGISSSCSNSVCTLTCAGTPFCTDLYCPGGISTSCSNGDCKITCNGGSQCGQVCTSAGACAVFSDPHVVGFDSFQEHQIPAHLVLAEVGTITHETRPIDVNSYGTGDYWLVKSSMVQIQARFAHSKAFVPDRAAIGAVAIGGPFLRGKKLIAAAGGQVVWDGQSLREGGLLYSNLSHGAVFVNSNMGPSVDGKSNHVTKAQLPLGVNLHIVQFEKYLDIKIKLPNTLQVDGECGNFNGVAEDDTEALVSKRMGGLGVVPEDSLF